MDSHENGETNSNMTVEYINRILMEDIDEKVSMYQGQDALQATEKPFYDILGKAYPSLSKETEISSDSQVDCLNGGGKNYHDKACTSSSVSDLLGPQGVQLITTGCASEFDHLVLQFMRGADEANKFVTTLEKLVVDQGSDELSVSKQITEGTIGGQTKKHANKEMNNPRVEATDCASEFDHMVVQFMKGVDEANKFVPILEELVVDQRSDGLSVSKQTTEKTVGGQTSKHANKKRNHPCVEGLELLKVRNSKHLTISASGIIRNETLDSVLLCNGKLYGEIALLREMMEKQANNNQQKFQSIGYGQGQKKSRGKKQQKEVVDLMTLLIQCAQAIASNNRPFAIEVLKKIMHHSSPHGDGSQRLAICFANGLKARLAGTGSQVHQSLMMKRANVMDMLKAYHLHNTACPFMKIAYYFSNKTIVDVLEGQPRLHIIDFGYFGFQWPSLFQQLAKRQGAPPRIRITCINVLQPGFLPSERIDATAKRLAEYANKFKVPFHYRIITKLWETVCVEDLNIDQDEVLAINCMFRMKNLGGKTEDVNSARDSVLHTMKEMNPDVLITGVVNGLYSSPFFVPRFREALFHYSSLYDILDTNVPLYHEGRILIERDLLEREAFNVVACEGAERIERPESYRRWQARIIRAGFKQLPINQAIYRSIHDKKKHYHEDFVFDKDNGWLLQGWKGRIIHALSSWKPKERYTEK